MIASFPFVSECHGVVRCMPVGVSLTIAPSSNNNSFNDLLGDSGIYFKNDNLHSLLNVLNQLNNADLDKIWNKQYDHIKKYYNSQKVLDDWIYVYNNL